MQMYQITHGEFIPENIYIEFFRLISETVRLYDYKCSVSMITRFNGDTHF